MDIILDSGITLIVFLQSLGDWLGEVMKYITFLGNEEFYLLIMPAFYWSINTVIGIRLGLLLLIGGSLNGIVKMALTGPRPYWYSTNAQAVINESSFGLPSGHAQNAASIWGGLAASLKTNWAWALAIVLIFFIGLSRMILGVHFPSDVLLGWILGFLFLWVYLKLEAPVKSWLDQNRLGVQIGAVFAFSLALIVLTALVRFSLGDWVFPSLWMTNLAFTAPGSETPNPIALEGVFSNAGAFFGLAAGALWLESKGGFRAGGSWSNRAACYFIGLVGVIVLWYGLGSVLPDGENLAAFVLRYARYGLVGLWISALAPLIFRRLGLLNETPKKEVPATG